MRRTHSGWSEITSREDWERVYDLAEEDYYNGDFLIEQLGGQRYLEPSVALAILVLREGLIEQLEIRSAFEYMMMDMALIAYYNTLRAQRMLGDLATQIERELFQGDSLSVNLSKGGRIVDDFKVEEMLNRASDKLQAQIERANQMMIRNIKTLVDLKKGNLVIRTEQINIAQQQINQVVKSNKKKRPSRGKINGTREDSDPTQ